MRKFLPQFLLVTIALVGVGFFFAPHEAHAAGTIMGWAADKFLGGTEFIYGLFGKIFWFGTIPLTSSVLWLVGMMIDLATNLSLNNNFFGAPAVSTMWAIIRDLCNMLFIFVLIWAGLRTILNIGNAVAVRKTIVGVVIAALFINFSLFITKAIIDVSNIGTAWFVQGVENVGGGTSVSDSVRSVLQMSKLAENKDAGSEAWTLQSFVAGFALTVLNCVAIYVFFKVAFFLVARIVTFFFLLVTSPLGFVGGLEIPQLTEYSTKWWKELRNQALMAPMFFLMLYITLFIVDQVDMVGFANGITSNDPISGSGFGPANYVMFAIIIMMLHKCLETAEEYSGELGGQIAKGLRSATGVATAGVAGFGSYLARAGVRGGIAAYKTPGVGGAAPTVADRFTSFKQTAQANLGAPLPIETKLWTSSGRTALKNTILKKTASSSLNPVTFVNTPGIGAEVSEGLQGVMSGKVNSTIGSQKPEQINTTVKQNAALWTFQNFIDYIGSTALGTAGRDVAISGMMRKLPPAQIGTMTLRQLQDPDVIVRIEPKHLQEIQKNMSDSDRATLRAAIYAAAGGTGPNDPITRSVGWLNGGGGTSF